MLDDARCPFAILAGVTLTVLSTPIAVPPEHIRTWRGIPGNSHMIMRTGTTCRSSDFILQWIGERSPNEGGY